MIAIAGAIVSMRLHGNDFRPSDEEAWLKGQRDGWVPVIVIAQELMVTGFTAPVLAAEVQAAFIGLQAASSLCERFCLSSAV